MCRSDAVDEPPGPSRYMAMRMPKDQQITKPAHELFAEFAVLGPNRFSALPHRQAQIESACDQKLTAPRAALDKLVCSNAKADARVTETTTCQATATGTASVGLQHTPLPSRERGTSAHVEEYGKGSKEQEHGDELHAHARAIVARAWERAYQQMQAQGQVLPHNAAGLQGLGSQQAQQQDMLELRHSIEEGAEDDGTAAQHGEDLKSMMEGALRPASAEAASSSQARERSGAGCSHASPAAHDQAGGITEPGGVCL